MLNDHSLELFFLHARAKGVCNTIGCPMGYKSKTGDTLQACAFS